MIYFQHAVPAGFPAPVSDERSQRIDLNEHLMPHPAASFLFRVQGDSMRDIGILDGDTIIVDRAISPRHGHIVLAVIDGAFTVKRLYRKAGMVRLLAENPQYPPIEFSEAQELRIWGVVISAIRKLI